jgi:hypothetical protein
MKCEKKKPLPECFETQKVALSVLILTMAFPISLSAQETINDTAPETAEAPKKESAEIGALREEFKAQRELIEQLRDDSEQYKKTDLAQQQEIEQLKMDQEQSRFGQLEALESTSVNKYLKVFGFFDLSFSKYFLDEESPRRLPLHDTSSFVMTNLNLYFQSDMSTTLSALVEIRFSFLPHGTEHDYFVYDRTDTEVMDPATTQYFNLGGLAIERVHLKYSPFDWLQLTAGRFCTPYGIWNIDHGSPVVIPVALPYMQLREMMPLTQTGIKIHGRFFPLSRMFFDYAVTFSNGRGPMDAVYDLDENKGLGLRLKLIYEGKKVETSLGGYGYYGSYTDLEKKVVIPIEDAETIILPEITITEDYDELIGSLDFLIEFFGVRFQAEYVRRHVKYNKLRELGSIELMSTPQAPGARHVASFIGQDAYGLLSYDLPLQKWSDVIITPFAMLEWNENSDTLDYLNVRAMQLGINIKPSAHVTLKAAYGRIISRKDIGGLIQKGTVQMAVSF